MRPNYDCAQDELYMVCRLGWLACSNELASFTAFKAFYNAALITTRKAAIDAAEAMPDEASRTAIHEIAGRTLDLKAEEALNAWQGLKQYMRSAYTDKVILESNLDAAGAGDYRAASTGNREKLLSMMKSGDIFIGLNAAALSAGNNMPAGFAVSFTALKDEIELLTVEFLNKRQVTKQETEAKNEANNLLYADLMTMFEDGVYLFKTDEAKRDQFVFSRVLEVVTPPGVSGIRFRFIKFGDNTSIEGVSVIMQKEGGVPISAVSDIDGRVKIDTVAGNYKCLFKKDGFEEVGGFYDVETGVVGNKLIVMVAV